MSVRRRRWIAVLAAAVVATGCGVPLQDEPAPLEVRPAPSPVTPTSSGRTVVMVYLVREGRLVQETRTADDASRQSVLSLLAEGPTAVERVVGTTTALAPGEYTILERPGPMTVIDVPVQFTQIEGDLQLLAAAQLVWTVSDRHPRTVVRMRLEGDAIELPTDRGLTSGPVRRSDYMSVAPEEE